MNKKAVIKYISQWLKTYLDQSPCQGFVVGVSGGIDSALSSTLAAQTGAKVLLVEMPIHQCPKQVSRAQQHMRWLEQNYTNVRSTRADLTDVFTAMLAALPADKAQDNATLAGANTRARLRMTCLYHLASLNNALVVGTGNKIEDFGVGFFTKYGDGGVDLSPIADLVKTEVFALAQELGVNQDILNAPPTDGLWGDERCDEDQLGASYPELEWAMSYQANGENLSVREQEVLAIYQRLNQANQHKILPIPICSIPENLRTI